jgi:rhodanese-related sulfurtransferase
MFGRARARHSQPPPPRPATPGPPPPPPVEDPVVIPGAVVRELDDIAAWRGSLESWRTVVTYCAEGHDRGRGAAEALSAAGLPALSLEGGLAGWRAFGLATAPLQPPTRWITRERPKIDRIACPWLVRRFIDPSAEFIYVPAKDVLAAAAARHATPYDVPDVAYTHEGDRCSFDAFIARHALRDVPLQRLADIVRAADTGRLDAAAEAAGLAALSLGLSRLFADDHAMLAAGMMMYDALYAWCRDTSSERHAWSPAALLMAT